MPRSTKPRGSAFWETLKAQYEAGTPMAALSRQHSVSVQGIQLHKKAEGWTPQNKALKSCIVKAALLDVNTKDNHKGVARGEDVSFHRSAGQPIGKEGTDREFLSKFGALVNSSAPEAKAVLDQAGQEIALMKQHQTIVARASIVAENILTRLHALVVEGTAADVITFETKTGKAYHRVPFLGDRESVSDALLKCANAISKLIPLQRQAHGLTEDKGAILPSVTLIMPNIKVISVDGTGKIIRGGLNGAAEPIDVSPTGKEENKQPTGNQQGTAEGQR
jgi:hypothetical protein